MYSTQQYCTRTLAKESVATHLLHRWRRGLSVFHSFLRLSRLPAPMTHLTGANAGYQESAKGTSDTFTCHSSHAYCTAKTRLRSLIRRLPRLSVTVPRKSSQRVRNMTTPYVMRCAKLDRHNASSGAEYCRHDESRLSPSHGAVNLALLVLHH